MTLVERGDSSQVSAGGGDGGWGGVGAGSRARGSGAVAQKRHNAWAREAGVGWGRAWAEMLADLSSVGRSYTPENVHALSYVRALPA